MNADETRLPEEDELAFLLAAYDDALAAGSSLKALSPVPTADCNPGPQLDPAYLNLVRQVFRAPAPGPRPPAGTGGTEANGPPPVPLGAANGDLSWTTLGRFQIRRELGRGGFGVVFLAYDPLLGREVALKVPRADALVTPELRERFRREAYAASNLEHPNLVPVYEAGEDGPVCFLIEAYCPGPTLADWLKQRTEPVPFRDAAELMAALADAVEHAHRRGVLHRDLKPANVLLQIERQVGCSDGPSAISTLQSVIPRITDFGLAKLLGSAAERPTHSRTILGTASYIAPEQAAGKSKQHGRAVDIYSLGAILYELLTGRPPFQGENELETLVQVRTSEPVPPSRLRPKVPRDLETICLKCLQKEPPKRYASAEALAEDLRHFLAGEPICARPTGHAERFWRWCRRNPGLALSTSAAVLLLVTVSVVASLAAWWLNKAEQATEKQLRQTQQAELKGKYRLFDAKLAQARASRWSRQKGQYFESWQALTEAAELARELELGQQHIVDLRNEAIASLALADVQLEKEWEGWPTGSSVGLAFDADLEHYARSDLEGNISIRRVQSDRELSLLPGEGSGGGRLGAAIMKFSPNGDLLAVRYWNALPGKAGNFRLWDWQQRKIVFEPSSLIPGYALDFSPDGRYLALGLEGSLILYELATKAVRTMRLGFAASHVAFHPEGKQLAIASNQGGEVRDLTTDNVLLKLSTPRLVWQLAWHPDGVLLAGACNNRQVYLWDTATGQHYASLQGHQHSVTTVAFSPGGDILVSSGWDGTSRFWDPWARRELLRLPCVTLQFSGDGRRLASRAGQSLSIWQVRSSRECRSLPRGRTDGEEGFNRGSFSADDRWLAIATNKGIRLWDLARGKEQAFLEVSELMDVQFHPTGKELFTCGAAGLYRWPVEAQPGLLRIGPPRKLPVAGSLKQIGLDRDGRILSVAATTPHCSILDLENLDGGVRSFRHPLAFRTAVSPDGCWIASATGNGFGVKVWEAATGKIRDLLPENRGASVTFSPDGRWLVTGATTEFDIWTVGSWKLARPIRREHGVESEGSAAFSRDGKVLAVTDSPSMVHLLDPVDGRLLAKLQSPEAYTLNSLALNSDGSRLVTCSQMGNACIWDLRRIREQLTGLGLDWDPVSYPAAAHPGDGEPVRVKVHLGMARTADPRTIRQYRIAQEALTLWTNPFDPAAHSQLGAILLEEEKPAVAFAHLSFAVLFQPEHTAGYYNRTLAAFRLGRWSQVVTDTGHVLRRQPDHPQALLLRGQAYQTLGRHAEAVADFTTLLAHDSDDSRLYKLRADSYTSLNEHVRAVADREKALELDPNSAALLNELAQQLATGPVEQRDLLKALSLANRAMRLQPNNIHRNTLGMVYYRQGRYQEACLCFEQDLQESQQYAAWDLFFLAMCQHHLGDAGRARECYDRAVRWCQEQQSKLPPHQAEEVKRFQAEAGVVLTKLPEK